MFTNYLKVALRNLIRYKSFSLINILGLSIGMPICLLVVLVINGQRDLDQFHTKKDRIFRILTHATYKATGNDDDVATAPGPLGPLLVRENPDVEQVVRLSGFSWSAKAGEEVVQVEGFYAEQSFFDLFSFELKQGDPATALRNPFSGVIREDLARTLFGDDNPVGRILSFAFGDLLITGVMREPGPSTRSHIDRPLLVSFSTLDALQGKLPEIARADNWNATSRFYQYVLLSSPARVADVEASMTQVLLRHVREEAPYDYRCTLQPLTGIAFGQELVNQIGNVMEGPVLFVFIAVALVVMLPVLFNFVSLTVARSMRRSKEVGIRKVIGARRRDIVTQMIFESVLISSLALIPATLLLDLMLPLFNGFQFVEYIAAGWKGDWRIYTFFLLFGTASGLVAGLIPAFVLSSIQPIGAMRGLTRMPGFSGITLRKVFLVIQFSLSLLFISLTLIFHRQLSYMLGADYGFDKEHVISVSLGDVPYERFRAEALRVPGVLDVAAVSDFIGRANPDPGPFVRTPAMAAPIRMIRFAVSDNYLTDRSFTLVAGRNLSARRATERGGAMVINETGARRLGFSDPSGAIGQVVSVGDNASCEVVGVVRDFHYARLQNAIDPVMLVYDPDQFYLAMVHVAPGRILPVVGELEEVWASVSGSFDQMRFRFLDDYILGAYNDMRDITLFLSIIGGLAIVLSCLGLLGMSIYSTEVRTKEVGVRKVLGASVASIVLLLSRDLFTLLLFAVILVAPILWAFVDVLYVEKVAFRPDLEPGLFVLGFLLVLGSALITVGSQTLRSARKNPVEALSYE